MLPLYLSRSRFHGFGLVDVFARSRARDLFDVDLDFGTLCEARGSEDGEHGTPTFRFARRSTCCAGAAEASGAGVRGGLWGSGVGTAVEGWLVDTRSRTFAIRHGLAFLLRAVAGIALFLAPDAMAEEGSAFDDAATDHADSLDGCANDFPWRCKGAGEGRGPLA